jgi:dihydropteroate synthase
MHFGQKNDFLFSIFNSFSYLCREFMNKKRLHIGLAQVDLSHPCVMGILNVTPDSFFAPSRVEQDELVERAEEMLNQGAYLLDIGGCSTRPGGVQPTEEEEWSRVAPALEAIRSSMPEAILSLDTYRPEIARRALTDYGEMIINDISGGDDRMYRLVREADVPYVLTAKKPTSDMAGIQLILDPGIGFLGGPDADFEALRSMHETEHPLLVGVSRKSLIWKTLHTSPDEALPATQALHMYALMHGADILRVHDVREAVETITLFQKLKGEN